MRPVDGPVPAQARAGADAGAAVRLDEPRAVELHVALRREPREDQVAGVVVDEVAVAVPHEERGAPARLRGHLAAHPEPPSRPRVQAAQFAVAAHAVDVVADDQRGRDQGVQAVGLIRHLAAAAALPQHRRGRPIRVEPHHHRAVVELRDQQVAAAPHRGRDRHAGAHLPFLLPVDRAGLRIERDERRRVPDDELPRAARLVDDRLAVAHLPDHVDRAPELLAGPLVEGDDQRVRLAADDGDQPVAVDQRRARGAPGRDAGVVLGDVVLAPDHVAGLDVETEQAAGGAGDVDPVTVDGRRGPRAAGVRNHQHAVGGPPLAGPENLAGLLVERHDALGAVERPRLRILQPVEHEHAAVGDGRTRVAGTDRRPPLDLQPLVRKRLDDAVLVPDPEPVRSAPLPPVVRRQRHREQATRDERERQLPYDPHETTSCLSVPLQVRRRGRPTAGRRRPRRGTPYCGPNRVRDETAGRRQAARRAARRR